MGRFRHRLTSPLPTRRETWRYFRTPGVMRNWGRPVGREHVPVEAAGALEGDGVQWLGHATALLRIDGLTVLTDPVFAPRLGPVRRAHEVHGFADDLEPDIVLVSHDHRDHLDLPTARAFPDAKWLAPLGVGAWLRRRGFDADELDWGQTTEHGGVRFRCVPAHHWSRRGLFDTAKRLWAGWVVEGSWKAYFAGDTALGPRVEAVAREHPDIDVALLPIGGCEPRWFMRDKHMSPEDAVDAMELWPGADLVPIHWGTYHMSQEPLHEPIVRLRAAWEAAGHDRHRLWELPIGGRHAVGDAEDPQGPAGRVATSP